jgi:hypothetical protein
LAIVLPLFKYTALFVVLESAGGGLYMAGELSAILFVPLFILITVGRNEVQDLLNKLEEPNPLLKVLGSLPQNCQEILRLPAEFRMVPTQTFLRTIFIFSSIVRRGGIFFL